MCVRRFWFPEFFISGPCQGAAGPPLFVSGFINHRWPFLTEFTQDRLECNKKSPTTTLNKRSLWESLFRPRSRPFKCATPYFKIPNSLLYCCKLTCTRPRLCNRAIVHAAQPCTKPTTRASRGAARQNFVLNLRAGSAFAAVNAANERLRCQYGFWGDASISD